MKHKILFILLLLLLSVSTQAQTPLPNISCNIFPNNHIFNTRLDTLLASGHIQVDTRSNIWLDNMGRTRTLRPDFGEAVWPPDTDNIIGIPYNVVDANQPQVPVNYYLYGSESDPGPMPIPPNALREGGPTVTSGDRHVLVVDDEDCMLYELWYAYKNPDNSWQAGSGAVFDLMSNWLRPDGWTSSDAAGLPVLPFLPRYEDILAGVMPHTVRFTLPQTAQAYVWPARHAAGSQNINQSPPMGQIFLLNPNFDISGMSPAGQIIATAMKQYGIILADNGSAGFISGTHDPRWNISSLISDFSQITFNDFVAVDICKLRVHPDSGEASINANPSGAGCTRNQGNHSPGGYVQGRVRDPLGNPLAEITVSAGTYGSMVTDFTGTYLITQIPRNQNFVLLADGTLQGLSMQWWLNSDTLAGATTIQLTNTISSAYGRHFTIGEIDDVTGTVYASDGVTPLPDVPIWIAGRNDVICTDTNGEFLLPLVVGVAYKIGVGGIHAHCSDSSRVLRWYPDARTAQSSQPIFAPSTNIDFILPDVVQVQISEQLFLAHLQHSALMMSTTYPLLVDVVTDGVIITLKSADDFIGTAQVAFISENGLLKIYVTQTTGIFADKLYDELPQMIMNAFDTMLASAGIANFLLEGILFEEMLLTFLIVS